MGAPLYIPGSSGGGSSAPAGAILAFGGSAAPSGWLLCDGGVVSRATYASLFAVTGEAFGAGDGLTTFSLPDFRGRVPVGVGGVAFTALGAQVGEETHQLGISEIASHVHVLQFSSAATTVSGIDVPTMTPGSTTNTDTAGGDQPHNNIQPSMCINYIIKT